MCVSFPERLCETPHLGYFHIIVFYLNNVKILQITYKSTEGAWLIPKTRSRCLVKLFC